MDARVRQEEDARKAIAAMQASARDVKGGRNDKVLKQARQKQEKISRIGLFREDGRRYKLQSLATFDDDAVLLPDKVEPKSAAFATIVLNSLILTTAVPCVLLVDLIVPL